MPAKSWYRNTGLAGGIEDCFTLFNFQHSIIYR